MKKKTTDHTHLWLEKKDNQDFPFYNDLPIFLTWPKWTAWLLLTLLSFFIFSGLIFEPLIKLLHLKQHLNIATTHPIATKLIELTILILTLAIIFITYSRVTQNRWSALFKSPTKKEILFSAMTGLGGIILFFFYEEFILKNLLHLNMLTDTALETKHPGQTGIGLLKFIEIIIQLIAEEMLAIVPFLFILAICYKLFSLQRKTSIIIAWILSSLIFGLYHLPSYNWHIAQVILAIAVSRIILTIPYLRYKNIWASYICHLCWDLIPLLAALFSGLSNR